MTRQRRAKPIAKLCWDKWCQSREIYWQSHRQSHQQSHWTAESFALASL